MQFKTLFVTLLAVGFSSAATTPCVRDACYNQVGTNAAGRPNASSRSADCRAALKTVIDSDITVTATITTTVYPFTVTTTGCPAQATLTVREEIHERCAGAMPRGLGKRDTIIVAGPKPAYVSSCGNLQDYASACLCYGVTAQTVRASVTVTSTSTISINTPLITGVPFPTA